MKTKLLFIAICLISIFKIQAQGGIRENKPSTTKEQTNQKQKTSITFEFIVDQNSISKETKKLLEDKKIKPIKKDTVTSNINVFSTPFSNLNGDTTKSDTPKGTADKSPELTHDEIEILKKDSSVYIVNPALFNHYRMERRKIRDRIISNRMLSKETKNDNVAMLLDLDKKIKGDIDRIIVFDTLFDKLRDKLRTDTKSPNNFTSWFPSSNRNKKYIFYNNIYSKKDTNDLYIGNSATLEFSKNSTSTATELVATYFGPFRTSFGTLVTNSSSSDAATNKSDTASQASSFDDALQRLKSNGGNMYLNVEYPVFCSQTKYATAYGHLYGKGGMVFTQVSNDVDTTSGNGSVGANGYASVASDDKSFILYVNCNFGYYFGSREFYQKLKLTDEKGFAFGQVTFGMNISKSLRFTYTPWTFGSDASIRTERGTIGIQILTGLFKT